MSSPSCASPRATPEAAPLLWPCGDTRIARTIARTIAHLASTRFDSDLDCRANNARPGGWRYVFGGVSLEVHVVVAGDTLWDVAVRHGVTLAVLLAANPQICDRGLIHLGDRITISPRPPGRQDRLHVDA